VAWTLIACACCSSPSAPVAGTRFRLQAERLCVDRTLAATTLRLQRRGRTRGRATGPCGMRAARTRLGAETMEVMTRRRSTAGLTIPRLATALRSCSRTWWRAMALARAQTCRYCQVSTKAATVNKAPRLAFDRLSCVSMLAALPATTLATALDIALRVPLLPPTAHLARRAPLAERSPHLSPVPASPAHQQRPPLALVLRALLA
jgi:hypothetical protein